MAAAATFRPIVPDKGDAKPQDKSALIRQAFIDAIPADGFYNEGCSIPNLRMYIKSGIISKAQFINFLDGNLFSQCPENHNIDTSQLLLDLALMIHNSNLGDVCDVAFGEFRKGYLRLFNDDMKENLNLTPREKVLEPFVKHEFAVAGKIIIKCLPFLKLEKYLLEVQEKLKEILSPPKATEDAAPRPISM